MIEELIERCVEAGVAARRAHARLLALEAQHPRADPAELAEALAEADRLTKAYVESQQPIAEASGAMFHTRMLDIQHRIAERLR